MKDPLQPFCLIWFGYFPPCNNFSISFMQLSLSWHDCKIYLLGSLRPSKPCSGIWSSSSKSLSLSQSPTWCCATQLDYFLRHNFCSCCSHSCLEFLPFYHSRNHLASVRIQITNYKALDHQNHQLKTHQTKRWKKIDIETFADVLKNVHVCHSTISWHVSD